MKKTLSIIFLILILFSIAACSDKKPDPKPEMTTTVYETTDIVYETSETTDIVYEDEKLSESGDVILASGYDENGNLFELVGFEEENYIGTTTKIGVIKNNKWLLEPTTDFPFINDGNLLLGQKSIYDLKSKYSNFNTPPKYIGNGCFEYENVIYNCNNNKFFDITKELDSTKAHSINEFYYNDCNQRENMLILEAPVPRMNYRFYYYLLNTSTMEYNLLFGDTEFYYYNKIHVYAPYNDGLFFASYDGLGFFNKECEKIIDISEYALHKGEFGYDYSGFIFENGTCGFHVINDQNNTYFITIDKAGKVLKSSKVD